MSKTDQKFDLPSVNTLRARRCGELARKINEEIGRRTP